MDTELIWGLVRVILALAIIVPLTILATRWYGRRQVGGRICAQRGSVLGC